MQRATSAAQIYYLWLMRTFLFVLYFLIHCMHVFAQAPTHRAGELTGYVDMHAHPRGDLAYGTELFYGAPYGDIAEA
jgi:hypothetical protein